MPKPTYVNWNASILNLTDFQSLAVSDCVTAALGSGPQLRAIHLIKARYIFISATAWAQGDRLLCLLHSSHLDAGEVESYVETKCPTGPADDAALRELTSSKFIRPLGLMHTDGIGSIFGLDLHDFDLSLSLHEGTQLSLAMYNFGFAASDPDGAISAWLSGFGRWIA